MLYFGLTVSPLVIANKQVVHMNLKKNLIPGLMILVSCGVGLGLAEIVLRVIEPTSDVQVIEINETEFGDYTSLRPNASGQILGRKVSINSRGYRGKLHPYHKDPDHIRVLYFGDSHVFSMGADDEHTFPAVAQNRLNNSSRQFESLNFGVLGQDMRQILMHIDNHAFKYDPDMIVFTFHSGDLLESPYDMVKTTEEEESLDLLYRINIHQISAGLCGPSKLNLNTRPYQVRVIFR